MNELAGMSDDQIREYAKSHARLKLRSSEKSKRTAQQRKNAGLVSRTVYVPAKFADQVAPTIARMVAELTQAEADQASSVVPETPPVEWHFAQG